MDSNQISENIAASTSKGALIEKIVFAIVPITFSCIVYLLTALNSSNNRIIELENKIRLIVTVDNRLMINPAAEIAREKLRQDFLEADTAAKIQSTNNLKEIEFLKWRVSRLEK